MKIGLFLGYVGNTENEEFYPYYREAENVEIYERTQVNEFITLKTSKNSDHSTSLPLEGKVVKISNDPTKNIRYLYLTVPESDIEQVIDNDPRWEQILEANP